MQSTMNKVSFAKGNVFKQDMGKRVGLENIDRIKNYKKHRAHTIYVYNATPLLSDEFYRSTDSAIQSAVHCELKETNEKRNELNCNPAGYGNSTHSS